MDDVDYQESNVTYQLEQQKNQLRKDVWTAIINAPSISENMSKQKRLLSGTASDDELKPKSGVLRIEDSHLYPIAFQTLREYFPALSWGEDGRNLTDDDQIEHELDHLNRAMEVGLEGSLLFCFGFDGKKSQTALISGELDVFPAINLKLSKGVAKISGELISEISSAPKGYLSEGDQSQIK